MCSIAFLYDLEYAIYVNGHNRYNLNFSYVVYIICVYIYMCVGTNVCICVWRCEVDVRCHPQSLSSSFIEIGSPNGT